MAVILPYRIGHPTLFIPWDAISISPSERGILFRKIGFELDRGNGITLWLYEKTARRLLTQQSRLNLPSRLGTQTLLPVILQKPADSAILDGLGSVRVQLPSAPPSA